MTIKEFVEAVNALDNRDEIDAELVPDGTVLLNKCGYSFVAALEAHDIKWQFYCTDLTIPTKILKLMVELAESKEKDNKYVILNGKPFSDDGNISIRAFLIIDDSLDSNIVSIDDLNDFAYTKEELEQFKSTLPEKLQDAVDMLTVTVGEAKEVLKGDAKNS